MKCAYHPDTQAFNTCGRCGERLCDGCAIAVDGRVVCKVCIASAMNMGPGVNSEHAHSRRAEPADAPKPRRYISGLWIFLLSGLPGLNFMAMGLMKRGLFFMSAFFGLVYLMIGFRVTVFPFVIAMLFFASLCDAQSKRRRINSGEYVSDDIDDVIRFAVKYKTPLLAAVSFLALHSFFSTVGGVWRGHHGGGFFTLALVCLVAWLFIRNRAGKIRSSDDHSHRHHDNHN